MTVITQQHDPGTHPVWRFHSSFTWSVPSGDDSHSVYTGTFTCEHDHMDEAAATACGERVARRMIDNPHRYPEVQQAIDMATAQRLRRVSAYPTTDDPEE